MRKIILIGNTNFGIKNNKILNNISDYFCNEFIPYIKENYQVIFYKLIN